MDTTPRHENPVLKLGERVDYFSLLEITRVSATPIQKCFLNLVGNRIKKIDDNRQRTVLFSVPKKGGKNGG
jgi:DNA-binding GntR family transcriptional regulator